MLAWQAEDFRHRTQDCHMPKHYAHRMECAQWSYYDDLCQLAGVETPIKPVIRILYEATHEKLRQYDLVAYKSAKFYLVDDLNYGVRYIPPLHYSQHKD